jgi:hypothetical protein
MRLDTELTMTIPPAFDQAFLDWFRSTTEAAWATYRPRTFDQYVADGTGGVDWQTGTRWVGGMTEAELAAVEARWSVRFPPDFRLFLHTLHTVDRPQVGAACVDSTRMDPVERSAFYDWRPGREGPPQPFQGLAGAFEWLFEGIMFDIEHDGLWLPSWGTRPSTAEGCSQHVRDVLERAPKLLPVYKHRYLLAEPCQAGNPVLSVWQTDIVVYGSNLREYFLWEFQDLLLPNREDRIHQLGPRYARRGAATYTGDPFPFWDELRAWRYRPRP